MKGLERLTGKEEEVMELIWRLANEAREKNEVDGSQPGGCTPKDVLAIYPEPKPHINTVATMFQALERKGYLTHTPQGRGYVYAPIVGQGDYGKGKLHSFVNRYFGNSYMNVVSALVQEEKVSAEELMDFLRELKKEGK